MSRTRDAQPEPFGQPIHVTRPLLPPLAAVMARLDVVWRSQQLTNIGAQHAELESALRAHLGVRELSLFTNGTVALITAIRALGTHRRRAHDAVHLSGDAACHELDGHHAGVLRHRSGDVDTSIRRRWRGR